MRATCRRSRRRCGPGFRSADLILVADNDTKPDRDINPGVEAARKAALAVDARLAIPETPGDANDLFCAEGPDAVAAMVAGAGPDPAAAADLSGARAHARGGTRRRLRTPCTTFMAAIPVYWCRRGGGPRGGRGRDENRDPLDFNLVASAALPPLLGLPVDVGPRQDPARAPRLPTCSPPEGSGGRKVVYAVPRHDLGPEQVAAFQALGVRAMLWKGRTAPDPTPENSRQLMCLDTEATFDALEVEQAVEQSCCKVKRGGELHLCPHFHACGYQRQKAAAQAAQVIVCAHDSLFHMKPDAIGTVGLLVIDEAFWQSGLRGLDGKATLTQDGLEPGAPRSPATGSKGRMDVRRDRRPGRRPRPALQGAAVTEPGPLVYGLLEAVGLTAEECRNAATLERRRLRDPGLLPGMGPVERRKRIEKVLPPFGQPWAPPGRCATMWLILAEALETGHDAAGAVLAHELTEHGSVRALKLRWRGRLRGGLGGGGPGPASRRHAAAGTGPALPAAYRHRRAGHRAPRPMSACARCSAARPRPRR